MNLNLLKNFLKTTGVKRRTGETGYIFEIYILSVESVQTYNGIQICFLERMHKELSEAKNKGLFDEKYFTEKNGQISID